MPSTIPVDALLDRLAPHLARALGLSTTDLWYAFRPALPVDFPRVLELRRAVVGSTWWDDAAFIRWRYFDRVLDAAIPYWVFEHRGDLIAAVGLEPVTFVIDATPVPGCRTLDIMVHPSFEGRGIGGYMNLRLLSRFAVTSVTGSNTQSHKLIARTWTEVTQLTAWKALIASRDFLERSAGRVGGLVAPVIDTVLAIQRFLRRPGGQHAITIRRLPEFDRGTDEVARSHETPGRLVVRRDSHYLNWRFTQNPRCAHRILGAYEQGRLVAYVVTRLNQAKPNPGREGEIVDWQVHANAGARVLPSLLLAALAELEGQGARLVKALASPQAAHPALRAAGLLERPGEHVPFFVRAASPEMHARLTVAADWFLTGGDFDVE